MDDKAFKLLEKMYSELTEFKAEFRNFKEEANNKFDKLNQKTDKNTIILEHMNDKVKILAEVQQNHL